jgi:hypothetical protein
VKTIEISKFFGYGVSIISVAVGGIFLLNVYLPHTIPTQLRVMCGIVFLLLGIYRYVATRFKVHQLGRGEG